MLNKMKLSLLGCLSLLLLLCFAGCASKHSNDPPQVPDAGIKPPPVVADAAVPKTQQQCLADCQTQHPTGMAKNNALDACWAANCNDTCNTGQATGQTYPPHSQADGGVKDCQYPTLTFSADCSSCNVDHCCSQWSDLFLDADGQALNQCSLNCWELPRAPEEEQK